MHSPIACLPTCPHDKEISVLHDIAEEFYVQHQYKTEAEDVTALNRKSPPFLRLPGELRNQIYEYLLHHTWKMKSDAPTFANNGPGTRNLPFEDLRRVLRTTETCKQMHAEMALLPFRFGTFVVNDSPYAFVNRWLPHRSLPQQQAITRLVFPCTYEPSYSAGAGWTRCKFSRASTRLRNVGRFKLSIVLPGLRNITVSIDVRTSDQHIKNRTVPRLSVAQVQEWTASDMEILKEACVDIIVTIKYQFCRGLYYLA